MASSAAWFIESLASFLIHGRLMDLHLFEKFSSGLVWPNTLGTRNEATQSAHAIADVANEDIHRLVLELGHTQDCCESRFCSWP